MSQLLTVFPMAKPNKQRNYTVQPVAMESGQAWDGGTPRCMCCSSLLMFFFFFFHFFFSTVHIKVHSSVRRLLFLTEYVLVWDLRRHRYHPLPREDCLSAPRWMSGFPRGRRRRLWKSLCVLVPLQCYGVHTHVARRCWRRCLLPGGRKLIIHALSHQVQSHLL